MSETSLTKIDFQLGGSSSSSVDSIPDYIAKEEKTNNNKSAEANLLPTLPA